MAMLTLEPAAVNAYPSNKSNNLLLSYKHLCGMYVEYCITYWSLQHAKMEGEGLVQIYHVNGINVYLGRQRGGVPTKRTHYAQTIFALKNERQIFSSGHHRLDRHYSIRAQTHSFSSELFPPLSVPMCRHGLTSSM